MNCDEEIKNKINKLGLILINQMYKNKETDPDLFVTLLHEMIHSHRNLMIYDVTRDGVNEKAYTFNNGRFEQNTLNLNISYADASQEILKGNIDTSNVNLGEYKNMGTEEVELLDNWQENKEDKMEKQYMVDEALVELMAFLAYTMYRSKEKGKEIDIWQALERTKEFYEGEDVGAACKIILKHHNLDLLNWMLDPIYYSNGETHYDFFSVYTKEDKELVEELYETSIRSRQEKGEYFDDVEI